MKNYNITKGQLFEKMQNKGLFWSYAKDIEYDADKDILLCETVLKYADMSDLRQLFFLYKKTWIKQVWEQQIKQDSRFKRLNYFLARSFFQLDVEASDFEIIRHGRLEKLRRLAG